MGLFRKKKKESINAYSSDKYEFRFEKYGERPSEFIIFAGLQNPEIAKQETLWISWEALGSIANNDAALEHFSNCLAEATKKYIYEVVEKTL